MHAESTTAPAATISVFCAATMMRASSGRPSASAPSTKSQPCSSENGGALRPRRFCSVAASPSSAGPKIGAEHHEDQEDHREGGELVAPEHAEDDAAPAALRRVGRDRVRRWGLSVPWAQVRMRGSSTA